MSECWYFAYGANMADEVFLGHRRMRPRSTESASLEGYELHFSEPGAIPFVEPAFANIEPREGGVVYGVLYRLSVRELARLTRSEGANYRKLRVNVVGEHSGEVEAVAYQSARTLADGVPSKRYRDLLVRGARAHGLPDRYWQGLKAHRATHVPVLSPLIHSLIGPLVRLREFGVRPDALTDWVWRRWGR